MTLLITIRTTTRPNMAQGRFTLFSMTHNVLIQCWLVYPIFPNGWNRTYFSGHKLLSKLISISTESEPHLGCNSLLPYHISILNLGRCGNNSDFGTDNSNGNNGGSILSLLVRQASWEHLRLNDPDEPRIAWCCYTLSTNPRWYFYIRASLSRRSATTTSGTDPCRHSIPSSRGYCPLIGVLSSWSLMA